MQLIGGGAAVDEKHSGRQNAAGQVHHTATQTLALQSGAGAGVVTNGMGLEKLCFV